MEQQMNLLDRVYSFLLKRGDEMELILSPQNPSEKTGIAYVQYDSVIPCSFLFMQTNTPKTLVLDVLFASKVAPEHQVAMNVLLSQLNESEHAGTFRLDPETGYVYFRQATIMDNLNLDDQQFSSLLHNLENYGLCTANHYAQELEGAFPS